MTTKTLEAINHFMPEATNDSGDLMVLRAYTYAVEHRHRFPTEFHACEVTEKAWLHLSSLVQSALQAVYVL